MNEKHTKAIEKLESRYKADLEALEVINQAKEDIEYYEEQGQIEKATAHIRNLEAYLHDWH